MEPATGICPGNLSRRIRRLAWARLSAVLVTGIPAVQAKPAPTPAQLWNRILPHRLAYIQIGHSGPVIYDFQDPDCPPCHALYKSEMPLVRAHRLTVRYVPVAFLTKASAAEAAAWLQAPDPQQALEHFETRIGAALRKQNFRSMPQAAPTRRTRRALKHNLRMMEQLGFEGTPAILYFLRNGRIGAFPGYVSEKELAARLPRMKP